ncbi:MAG: alpha/beta fold hydrolase [Nocardioides sp.]|uniref:alpha/beta hydrolase n=1 Tax=Nocardioides sp. TaxID=35761 RepID=UPI0039E6E301
MESTRITIESPAGTMLGYLHSPVGPSRAAGVLFLHGWTSDAESGYGDLPEQMAGRGFTALAVDLPGHGGSGGDRGALDYQAFVDAAIAAYDTLAAQSANPDITIVGTSLGGYLAARLAADRSVTRLILWVPTDFSDELTRSGQTFQGSSLTDDALAWRSAPHTPDDSAALAAFGAFEGRSLIIEAMNDELVPHQTIANYLAVASDADHVQLARTRHRIRRDPHKFSLAAALTRAWLVTEAASEATSLHE